MSRYIVKAMHLEKSKHLIIWNGGSTSPPIDIVISSTSSPVVLVVAQLVPCKLELCVNNSSNTLLTDNLAYVCAINHLV
jgi:hypothetical protein